MTVAPSAPTTNPTEAACDQAALAALVADLGAEAAAELLALFIAETRARLRRLADPALDAHRLLRDVHTLKGGAGTAAARRLATLAGALEARLRTGGTTGAADVAALQAAFAAYTDSVRAFARRREAAST